VAVSPLISCDSNSNHEPCRSPISEETQIPSKHSSFPAPHPILKRQVNHLMIMQPLPRLAEPKFTGMQQFSAFIQQPQRHRTVLGLAYVFLHPLLLFFGAFSDMLVSNSLHDSMPLRAPTFYSPRFTDMILAILPLPSPCA